jgi:hypothetical protein
VARGADEQVGPTVAVDVARARDRGAVRVAARLAGERVQERAGATGDQVGVPLRVARPARSAAENVVDAVAVEVAHVGDREAALVAGPAVEATQRGAGAAGVDPGGAGVLAGRAAPGLADDRVGGTVAVDVLERGDRPAEVLVLRAGVLPEDLDRLLEAGARG